MKTFHKLWPLLAVIFLAGAAGTGCTAKVKKAYHERQAENSGPPRWWMGE